MQKIYIILVMLFLWSCGKTDKEVQNTNLPAIAVKVSKVGELDSHPVISTSGKIEAVKSANLSTRIMGHVNKIHVQIGDKVVKGQLLLSINNTDLSAKLAQVNAGIAEATAAYNNSEKDLKRFTILFNENSATQKELDDITANYNMSKARLEAARQMKNEVNAQFSYSDLRAPFNGVVTNKFIKPGDMASPGMPLLEVEAPGKYQVLTLVPESDITKIKKGMKVAVSLNSINENIEGEVVELSSSSKNTGGQYHVKVALSETNVPILSGMYATVDFPVAADNQSRAVLIPIDAIIQKGQLSGVYTVSERNTALLRWLRLGRSYGDRVEVLSGLTTGESFILSSNGKLYNGAKISIQ
ncbi:efflux RND transporter periplasmic adaptor subunit [uncultured Eudoraea sp.]|uniref:efflux RND transporter periplasmic adaptor subunit n=1 Tax=uncultured Eudoraea sp. TaxID=1035614 RepID=UPI00261F407A|nr:efflux RND transporter periplasmic adaptor subunit [uncultured Eudoraea sp.]